MKLAVGLLFTGLAIASHAQVPTATGHGAPSGACGAGQYYQDIDTTIMYSCKAGVWRPPPVSGVGVSVLDFGADPTGATDSTAAFTNAIAAISGKGGRLWIPCGTYRVNPTSSFIPVSGTIIQGAGPYCTTLLYSGSTSTPIWLANNYVNGTGGQGQFLKFEDFTMSGNSVAGSVCFSVGTPSLATAKVQNVTFENMRVTACGSGITVNDVWALNIFASDIAFNVGDGIDITDPDAVTGMYLFGTRIHNNSGHSINNTGAGTVTQFEMYGGENTYSSGGTEVVLGNCRDCDLYGVWFEESGAGSTQNAVDVTNSIQVRMDNVHANFINNVVFASAAVSYISISNSTNNNGQANLVNVPSGSTHIDFGQNNKSNVGSSVGTATAQNLFDCPNATSASLTTSAGVAINACSGSNIEQGFANGTSEYFFSNVGNLSAKGLLSMSGSAFSTFSTGTSGAGMVASRNEADAFPVMTASNLNASSTGDIHDFSNSTGIVVRITQQGVFALTPSGTQPTCSATGGVGSTSSEGYFWYTKGSGATNGALQVCQNQSGTYSWVTH